MNLGSLRGNVAWYTLHTDNVTETVNFYKNLFNWQTRKEEMPGLGPATIFSHQGVAFCNVAPDPCLEKRVSQWINYIATDDIDTTLEKIDRYGGKIEKARYDIPGIGQTAVACDPFGTRFKPFTPLTPSLFGSAMGDKEGFICWNELMVNDPKKAIPFYSEIFGWKFLDAPKTHDYHEIRAGDSVIGGLTKTPPDAIGFPPQWMVYLSTHDLTKKIKDAENLGAIFKRPITTIPGVGQFSLMEDPCGCLSYLFQFRR